MVIVRAGTVVWLAAMVGCWPVVARAESPGGLSKPEPVIGLTMPFRESVLSAIQPGRLAQIAAPEGSTVKSGDLIFALDDGGQAVRAQMAAADAASTLDIELAEARWEQAQRDLERIQRIAESSGQDFATRKELDDALSTERIRAVELRMARFVHEQHRLAAQREQRAAEQFRVPAPFDGYVGEYLKELGETVNESEAVVTLAQLDPLLVSLDCPFQLAPAVKIGDQVKVSPVDANWPARDGVVSFISRVGDGGSQTLRVKVRVDNADQRWLAGMKVSAEFSPAVRSATRVP